MKTVVEYILCFFIAKLNMLKYKLIILMFILTLLIIFYIIYLI